MLHPSTSFHGNPAGMFSVNLPTNKQIEPKHLLLGGGDESDECAMTDEVKITVLVIKYGVN